MPQNYFTPFTDVFKAYNYIILIFSQNSFVHMAPFPNLEDNPESPDDEEPKRDGYFGINSKTNKPTILKITI